MRKWSFLTFHISIIDKKAKILSNVMIIRSKKVFIEYFRMYCFRTTDRLIYLLYLVLVFFPIYLELRVSVV